MFFISVLGLYFGPNQEYFNNVVASLFRNKPLSLFITFWDDFSHFSLFCAQLRCFSVIAPAYDGTYSNGKYGEKNIY